ncbi:hypothetical protein I8H89_01735 [Candidatus Saccharibacteria bacterium]|nr:hypothetical protein [Candidatus Saccharibacteria bacterium]
MMPAVTVIVVGGIFIAGAIYISLTVVTNRQEYDTRPHVVAARHSLVQTIWSKVDANYRFHCGRANGDEVRIAAYPVSLTAGAMVEIRVIRHSSAGYGQSPDVLFYRIHRWDVRVAKAVRFGDEQKIYRSGFADVAELREIEELIKVKHSLPRSPR